jgi:FG-GAP-like repeat
MHARIRSTYGQQFTPKTPAHQAFSRFWHWVSLKSRRQIGDFNHDGNLDLAVANYCQSCGESSVGVLFGNGSGSFGAPATYPVDWSLEQAIVSADFNKDGNLDLAVSDLQAGAIYVYLGDARGNFRLSHKLAAGFWPYSLVASDFNHDGNVDLLVGDNGGGDGPTELTMLHGKGDGTFMPAVEYPVDFWPAAISVGDLSGNGASDLVVVNDVQSVTVYLGRVDGSR